MTCMRQTKSADFALSTRAVPAALTLEYAAVGWAGGGIDVGPTSLGIIGCSSVLDAIVQLLVAVD
jgi:hypothetical protein